MTKSWYAENSNDPRLKGVLSLLPFDPYDSSSRKQMYSSHIPQALTLIDGTERAILAGSEEDYSKYVFSSKFPTDSTIIGTHHLYPRHAGHNSYFENPLSVIIHEDSATKVVDILEVTPFTRHHPHFGFRNKPWPAMGHITTGANVPGGCIVSNSPSVGMDGSYKFGVEFKTAYMSIPGVAEDGVVISRSAVNKLRFHRYESRTISWGKNEMALPIYGNGKIFPDIGDLIRDDGLLMVKRKVSDDLIVCDQSNLALEDVDYVNDERTYVLPNNQTQDMSDSTFRTHGMGRVVDVRIWYNGNPSYLNTETAGDLDQQPVRYEISRRNFYRGILKEYNRLKKRGRGLVSTPRFDQLVSESLSVVGHERDLYSRGTGKDDLRRHRRKVAMDTWEVEITVEYVVTPAIGFKLTDLHGGKGVICLILEDEHMPVDANGIAADVIMDPGSRSNRMIPGSTYEQYINAASWKLRDDLGKMTGYQVGISHADALQAVGGMTDAMFRQVFNHLLGFYEIFTPLTHRSFAVADINTQRRHLAGVLGSGMDTVQLFMPTFNPISVPMAIDECQRRLEYRPVYAPVIYTGNSGRRCMTRRNTLIGSVYYILLEKTPDDWSAVSSGRTQLFGVPGQVTSTDKYSTPVRQNSVRGMGETECRLYSAYAGTWVVAELADRNNNPHTHKHVLRSIHTAEFPTRIENCVDRKALPLGNAKPLQQVRHIGIVAGWAIQYKPYVDLNPKPKDWV